MSVGRSREARRALAIGEDAVTLVSRGPDGVRALTAAWELPRRGDPEPALASAFAELTEQIRERSAPSSEAAEIDVVLLPPVAESRLIDLPPMKRREIEAVLRRDAARYFLGGAIARVLGVRVPPSARQPRRGVARDENGRVAAAVDAGEGSDGHAGTPAAVFASAAPAQLVEAVHAAGRRVGWRIRRIVPAHAAWLAAPDGAGSHSTSKGPAVADRRVVVAVMGPHAHVLRAEGGHPVALRRIPADDVAEIVRCAGPGPGTALLLASRDGIAQLERALASTGWDVSFSPDAGDGAGPASPALVAAALSAERAEPELVPVSALAAERDRQRRLAGWLTAAAVLLFVAAGAVELWGAHRELNALRARRAEIRSDVAPLMAMRDSMAALDQRLAAIRALGADAPRWTRALTDLALLLPFEAHLTRFTAEGETLEIEAAGAKAGEALQALRAATSLRDVRMLGVVDRELDDGEPAVERFRIAARLAPPQEPAREMDAAREVEP